MSGTLRLAWRNLWRNRRRTWLTASAIAFSSALLVFMITIQLGAYDMFIDTSLRLGTGALQVQRPGYQEKPQMHATLADGQALAARLRAAGGWGVAARGNGFALVTAGHRSYGVPVIGVDPAEEGRVSILPSRVVEGRFLSGLSAQEIVIGRVLARKLKVALGDELTLLGAGKDGSIAAAVLPVVGFFESGMPEIDRAFTLIPLATFQDLYSMGSDVHAIVIAGLPLEQVEPVMAEVRRLLPPGQPYDVLGWQRLIPGLQQLIEADTIQNWFTYVVLIVIVTFSILNTFLMAVLERTREFGLMLALGATPLRIGAMVMLESTLLTLTGLALGIGLGGAVTGYFHVHGFTFPGMEELYAQYGMPGVLYPKMSFVTFTLGPAVIFAFTLAAAVIPALRIRRLQPVQALHAV